MIRCLIIKTSSLGDIVHTLPALTDAVKALGNIEFDWVVEENFKEIPHWHPAVNRVIPIALRRWRKTFFKSLFSDEWKHFKKQLKSVDYDFIIDAQGLLKSALICSLVKGETYGLNKSSARESIASWFYKNPLQVAKDQHAVERVRQLFAQIFNYPLTDTIDYGIKAGFDVCLSNSDNNHEILFFHGTTWETKHWPEIYWVQLANLLIADNYNILIPWGNAKEKLRAQRIREQSNNAQKVIILDKMNLQQMAQKLIQVKAVVSVDTGLAHLGAALDKPLISLFGPTHPGLTRPYASNNDKQMFLQVEYSCKNCLKKKCNKTLENESFAISFATSFATIRPPCYSTLSAEKVFNKLTLICDSYYAINK